MLAATARTMAAAVALLRVEQLWLVFVILVAACSYLYRGSQSREVVCLTYTNPTNSTPISDALVWTLTFKVMIVGTGRRTRSASVMMLMAVCVQYPRSVVHP